MRFSEWKRKQPIAGVDGLVVKPAPATVVVPGITTVKSSLASTASPGTPSYRQTGQGLPSPD